MLDLGFLLLLYRGRIKKQFESGPFFARGMRGTRSGDAVAFEKAPQNFPLNNYLLTEGVVLCSDRS